MKGSRSRRGRGKPFGVGGLRRQGRGKPRGTRRAPIAAAATTDAPPDAASDELVAVAEQRIIADPGAPPPPPPPARRTLWPFLLPLLLLVIAGGGVAWFVFLREQPAPAGGETASGEKAGTTTSVDLVELKRVLRRLDFSPGPDDGGLDPATHEAIRQFQHTAGLPETGEPSADLLDELRQVAAPLKAD
jgi:hypothetical protein